MTVTKTLGIGGNFANPQDALLWIQSQPIGEYVVDLISDVEHSEITYYGTGYGYTVRFTCSHNLANRDDHTKWYYIKNTAANGKGIGSIATGWTSLQIEYIKFYQCTWGVYQRGYINSGSRINNCIFVECQNAICPHHRGNAYYKIYNCKFVKCDETIAWDGGTGSTAPTGTYQRFIYNCVADGGNIVGSTGFNLDHGNTVFSEVKCRNVSSTNMYVLSWSLYSGVTDIDYCACDDNDLSGEGSYNKNSVVAEDEFISLDSSNKRLFYPKITGTLYDDGTDPSAIISTDFVGNNYGLGGYYPIGAHTFSIGSIVIQAIKIKLDKTLATQEDIGLYSVVSENSELRWSEAPLIGAPETWNHEILAEKGIGAIAESVDIRTGGNSVNVNDFTFTCKGSNQLLLRMRSLGIHPTGLTVELHEFVGLLTDCDSVSHEVMFTGIIEDYSYNQFETIFTAKSSFAYKRNKNLGTIITAENYPDAPEGIIGQIVPITFGYSDPDNGRYFKLIRTSFRDQVLRTSDFMPDNGYPPNMSLFPVCYKSDTYDANYACFLIGNGYWGDFVSKKYYPIVGKYVKVVDGESETYPYATLNIGKYRRIKTMIGDNISIMESTDPQRKGYVLELADFYYAKMKGYEILGSNKDFSTFLSVYDIDFKYSMDDIDCLGFVDGLISIYTYEENQFSLVLGQDISLPNGDVPLIDINPRVLNSDASSAESFIIIPVENIEPYLNEDNGLTEFGISENYEHPLDSTSNPVPGLFAISSNECDSQPTITGTDNYKDKDSTTYWEYNVYLTLDYPTSRFDYLVAFKITLPEIDDNTKFDNVYLGINVTSDLLDESTALTYISHFLVYYKSFYNKLKTPIDYDEIKYQYQVQIKSLPDDYYSDSPDESNRRFYFVDKLQSHLLGYKLFNLEINSVSEYQNIHEFLILFKRKADDLGLTSYIDDYIKFTELAIIFEKGIDLSEELYA